MSWAVAPRGHAEASPDDLGVGVLSRSTPDPMVELSDDWRRTRDLGTAADLVSAASVVGSTDDDKSVEDAALYILAHSGSSRPIRRIAGRLVSKGLDRGEVGWGEDAVDVVATELNPERQIRRLSAAVKLLRRDVRKYPHDPFRWVDLARAYLSLGKAERAERAMHAALGLAPAHRFVLRSAVRLFVHLGLSRPELPEEALRRLRRCPATMHDPWLQAAEIAVGMVLGKPPRSVKIARAMLASETFSRFDTSELAATVGSLEMKSGSLRAARKLFTLALRAPTENAVAQAAWSAHRDRLDIDDYGGLFSQSREGRAWLSFDEGAWAQSFAATVEWQMREPFSRRPIIFGSFLAVGPMGDFALGERIGRLGLTANETDPLVCNNLAFALANLGRVNEAETILSRVPIDDLGTDDRIAFAATWGLLCFRKGEHEAGRHLYLAAISAAERTQELEMACLAWLYLAREEAIAGSPTANESFERAIALLKLTPKPHLEAVCQQVVAVRSKIPSEPATSVVAAPQIQQVSPTRYRLRLP